MPLNQVADGTATFAAAGSFGQFVIPRTGVLDHREFVHRQGRVAAARFAAGQPWLVGVSTGRPAVVSVTAPAG